MSSLADDLQTPKKSIREFIEITQRVLKYLPEIISQEVDYLDYCICSSTTAGTKKSIRPFNKNLFLRRETEFINAINIFEKIIEKTKNEIKDFRDIEFQIVDKVIYTIQQSIGMGLDLFVVPNSARKHVGSRFEELIRALLKEMTIPVKKVILSIPYETNEGKKYYRCETDAIISPYESVKSDSRNIDPNEIVLSLKTTTKDRMSKIFIDKMLMERFLGHPIKIIGISQNDIQRKDENDEIKISYTFVSNLFMVYTKFLTQLEGYYYLDIPKRALEVPFNKYIFPFSKFILTDIWTLLRS